TLQLEDISVAEMIEESLRELKPLFESRNIECLRSPTLRDGRAAITVRADTRMLRQAFLNLARNAAEAIPDNQANRQVFIDTGSEQLEGQCWVVISTCEY